MRSASASRKLQFHHAHSAAASWLALEASCLGACVNAGTGDNRRQTRKTGTETETEHVSIVIQDEGAILEAALARVHEALVPYRLSRLHIPRKTWPIDR